MKRSFAQTVACLVACGLPLSAHAYFDFFPTPTEFASWPEYCAAQYVFIMEGRNDEVAGAYSPAVIQGWRDRIGEQTFLGMHHFCSSLHYLRRAQAERSKDQKRFLLTTASDEVSYSLRGADPHSMLYPEIIISYAMIKREQGDSQAAIKQLERAIELHPSRPKSYVVLALIHKREKRLSAARDILLRANEVTEGESSDVHYNLGLVNLEMGDVQAATESAHKAYALGYPLPWLKDKLRSMGKWQD